MRKLTNAELETVAGGNGGINIGSVGSANSAGNGNTVDAGHNSATASGNASGNSSNASSQTTTDTMSKTMTEAWSDASGIAKDIL